MNMTERKMTTDEVKHAAATIALRELDLRRRGEQAGLDGYWLSLYAQLRLGGDDHTTAMETVRGEQVVARR